MELREVEALLTKFYKGETSLEEEEKLKTYFLREDIPDAYQVEKRLLDDLKRLGEPGPESDFNDRLKALVEDEWRKETRRRFARPFSWSAAAAVAGLVVFFAFFNEKNIETQPYADTFASPEEAYAETKKILMTVSLSMNYGSEKLESLGELDQSLEKLQNLKIINHSINRVKDNDYENN